jgi:hypothetical protein
MEKQRREGWGLWVVVRLVLAAIVGCVALACGHGAPPGAERVGSTSQAVSPALYIQVTPPAVSFPAAVSQQLSATLHNHGATKLTTGVTWTVSDATVAPWTLPDWRRGSSPAP